MPPEERDYASRLVSAEYAAAHPDRYLVYVLEKVCRGLARADAEGTLSQQQAEQRLARWLLK